MAESKSAALPLGYAPMAPCHGGAMLRTDAKPCFAWTRGGPQLYSEGILRAILCGQATLAGHGAGRYNAPSPDANPLGGITALSLGHLADIRSGGA